MDGNFDFAIIGGGISGVSAVEQVLYKVVNINILAQL
jgi:hypothetical protein